eukprot:1799564-Pleurochrysis_carterae.AAC.1
MPALDRAGSRARVWPCACVALRVRHRGGAYMCRQGSTVVSRTEDMQMTHSGPARRQGGRGQRPEMERGGSRDKGRKAGTTRAPQAKRALRSAAASCRRRGALARGRTAMANGRRTRGQCLGAVLHTVRTRRRRASPLCERWHARACVR